LEGGKPCIFVIDQVKKLSSIIKDIKEMLTRANLGREFGWESKGIMQEVCDGENKDMKKGTKGIHGRTGTKRNTGSPGGSATV